MGGYVLTGGCPPRHRSLVSPVGPSSGSGSGHRGWSFFSSSSSSSSSGVPTRGGQSRWRSVVEGCPEKKGKRKRERWGGYLRMSIFRISSYPSVIGSQGPRSIAPVIGAMSSGRPPSGKRERNLRPECGTVGGCRTETGNWMGGPRSGPGWAGWMGGPRSGPGWADWMGGTGWADPKLPKRIPPSARVPRE